MFTSCPSVVSSTMKTGAPVRVASTQPAENRDRRIVGAEHEPRGVEFVRCRVRDRHRPGKTGRRLHVPVEIMHHDRPTDQPAGQRCLHLGIGRVEAPHEAELDEAPPGPCFGLDHLQTLFGGRGKRLFAQHRLARRDRGQGQRRMGLVGLAISTASTSGRAMASMGLVIMSAAPQASAISRARFPDASQRPAAPRLATPAPRFGHGRRP